MGNNRIRIVDNDQPAGLTPRQREVLLAIQGLSAPRVQPPSYAEIAAVVGGSAVSVMGAVHRLHAKGYIVMHPDKHRTIRVLRPVDEAAA